MPTTDARRAARRGLLLVLSAAVLWGTGGLVASLVYDRTDLTAVDVGFWRLAVAAAAGTPLLLRPGAGASSGGAGSRARLLGTSPGGTLAVGLGLAFYQASYFAAVERAGVSLATFVALGAAPVLVAVAEVVWLRRRPHVVLLVALALALTGLVLLIGLPGGSGGPGATAGALLALCSAAGYATVTLVSGAARGGDDPVRFAVRTFWVGALALLPLSAAGGLAVPADALAALALLYVGVGPTAGAYAMFFAGLRAVPASAASVATLVEPLTAAVLAAALLGERLGATGLAGAGALLLAVVALVARPASPSASAAVDPAPAEAVPAARG